MGGKRATTEARIDTDVLRERLSYDAKTGVLTWRIAPRRGIRAGSVAGSLSVLGYLWVGVDQQRVYAHRVCWFLKTGTWPVREIDHINGVKTDNRFCNLREATRSQNIMNTAKRADNINGVKGVGWSKTSEKWRARITINGKVHYLGQFHDKTEAAAAYAEAAKAHHKEFART